LNIWENNNIYVLYCCFMLHWCLNYPFWLHENQAKCCRNLQLNEMFLGTWKNRFNWLEQKLNRITRNQNPSVLHAQSNRSVPSSQVTELGEEPNRSVSVNRTPRLTETRRFVGAAGVISRPYKWITLYGLLYIQPSLQIRCFAIFLGLELWFLENDL